MQAVQNLLRLHRLAAGSRSAWLAAALAAAAAAPGPVFAADTEAVAADGRRVVLRDDGTWRAVDPAGTGAAPAAGAPDAAAAPGPQAVLQLTGQAPRGSGCRYGLRLENKLPYAIGNVVPYFWAQRADGVDLEEANVAFISLRPGDTQDQVLDFPGVACDKIARIRVGGGDRCEMGVLNKFTDGKGMCLARIEVVASPLVKFEK